MRIKITFVPVDNKLILPIHYNHIIQGMIYHNLGNALSQWYHDQGFAYYKRRFKLFTFSRLFVRNREYLTDQRKIIVKGPTDLWISAMEKEFLESLVLYLLKRDEIVLAGQKCYLKCVETKNFENEAEKRVKRVVVETMSPVTVYRTVEGKSKNKTKYVSPYEDEFESLIIDNLARKAKAYYRMSDKEIGKVKSKMSVKMLEVNRKIVTYFKKVVIEAWDGVFELRLPKEYFTLAYNAGLGSKNSQGFGMIKIIK